MFFLRMYLLNRIVTSLQPMVLSAAGTSNARFIHPWPVVQASQMSHKGMKLNKRLLRDGHSSSSSCFCQGRLVLIIQ